jgi:uncharacterized protein YjbJ (UPF0337 family)
MNKDQVKGRIEEAKGKTKESVGKATGNKELQRRGIAEKAVGKVKGAYGDLKQDIKEAKR